MSEHLDNIEPAAKVIAAILSDPTQIDVPMIARLPDAAFGRDATLVKFMRELHYGQGKPTTAANLRAYLVTRGWPKGTSTERLGRLAETFFPDSLEDLCGLVVQDYERTFVGERILEANRELLGGGSIARVQEKLREAVDYQTDLRTPTYREIAAAAMDVILTPQRGVPMGLPGLDDLMPKFVNGRFVVLAARPSSGKSTAILQCVVEAVLAGKRVMLAVLEDRAIGAAERILRHLAMIPSNKYAEQLTDRQQEKLAEKFTSFPWERVVPVDTSNIHEICAMARREKASEAGLDIIFIDQLSHLSGVPDTGQGRVYVYEEYCKLILNRLAIDLDIPAVLAHQINRDGAGREPALDDLKGSGALEEFAHDVIMLHRPEDDGYDLLVKIAKHRNGPIGKTTITWSKSTYRLERKAEPVTA